MGASGIDEGDGTSAGVLDPATDTMLRAAVRTIPDYPKPGILFRDVTTLMRDADAFAATVAALAEAHRGGRIDAVAGIEARGFILGGAVAVALGCGFVPLRKRGKLPADTIRVAYSLEYGVDEMEVHRDALPPGSRALLIDDLIATGGTAKAGVELLREIGVEVAGADFVIDLPDLGGADKLRAMDVPVRALLAYEGH